ncbi:LysR family transcriptional regulator [Vibrio cholerae]|uniref:LysR family transcriptional regulator n=1 Tax=Vibrio cholerae TaxID=666 RepID=UPI0003070180|nr:LysR family transcriptional regulator [Vibrio cholerae]OEC26341.1 LysR family transcriptional regulator [Vibrio cholerae]
MLNELKRIVIFNKVVECGSFTCAAEALGMTKSKVSEQITALEKTVNVRLLNRTTRKISLTTEGDTFYQRSHGLLNIAEEALCSVNHLASEVSGTIRIGTTIDVGTFLLNPLLAEFYKQYPKVNFDIQLDDGLQDLVDSNLDMVIRIGELTSSSLVGRVIAPFELGIYASQTYLENSPPIHTIQDLEQHDWVYLTRLNLPNQTLTLTNQEGVQHQVKFHSKHSSNSPLGVMTMVQNGLGVGSIASFLIDKLPDASLVRLFPDFYQISTTMNILYPSRKNLPPRVRLFIDYLVGTLCG